MTFAELVEKGKNFVRGRAAAYCRVFAGQDGEVVLRDLARFCRAHASTYHENPYKAARLDGRREVFLRIQQHLNLDTETLWRLYSAPPQKGEQ